MSGIYTGEFAGQVNVRPSLPRVYAPLDTLATVVAPGYLSTSPNVANNPPQPGDFVFVVYKNGQGIFSISITANIITLVPWVDASNVLLPVVNGDFATFNGTTGQIKDAGFLPSDPAQTRVVMEKGASVIGDLPKYNDVTGTILDSGISAASVAALLAGSGGGGGSSSVRSATIAGSFPTATTVITDPAITTSSIVIAAFVSSANVVSIQTVLPGSGQFTINTDTAPSTGVLEYISFIPSPALVTAGVVAGSTSFSSGPATFVMSAPGITPGMVVVANFQSQGTPSRIYTALPGTDQITFVVSSGPGVSVMSWVGMLPGDIAPLGLHAADYSYAGGAASVAISDASITASSIVVANFESEAGANYIQKVTPSAGTLTILVNADPGVSVFAYIATAAAGGGGGGTSTTPELVAVSTASATPGTVRAITGSNTNVNTTMTSGNLVGVRGDVSLVGASGGFVYGVQGKVIPTGTLSGSVWAPAVFGQYDLSSATLNGGQIAAIWGDMGATGGTFTNVTGARGIALTNTIASLTLFAMDYRYGKATNLFELDGSSSTYISAGAATPGGDLKKIAISIDGVTHYILAAATWS